MSEVSICGGVQLVCPVINPEENICAWEGEKSVNESVSSYVTQEAPSDLFSRTSTGSVSAMVTAMWAPQIITSRRSQNHTLDMRPVDRGDFAISEGKTEGLNALRSAIAADRQSPEEDHTALYKDALRILTTEGNLHNQSVGHAQLGYYFLSKGEGFYPQAFTQFGNAQDLIVANDAKTRYMTARIHAVVTDLAHILHPLDLDFLSTQYRTDALMFSGAAKFAIKEGNASLYSESKRQEAEALRRTIAVIMEEGPTSPLYSRVPALAQRAGAAILAEFVFLHSQLLKTGPTNQVKLNTITRPALMQLARLSAAVLPSGHINGLPSLEQIKARTTIYELEMIALDARAHYELDPKIRSALNEQRNELAADARRLIHSLSRIYTPDAPAIMNGLEAALAERVASFSTQTQMGGNETVAKALAVNLEHATQVFEAPDPITLGGRVLEGLATDALNAGALEAATRRNPLKPVRLEGRVEIKPRLPILP